MKSFVDLSLERAYRSSTHLIGRDFYAQLLLEAQLYRRAVGYFSSNVFSVAPDAHLTYLKRGGKLDIASSPLFSAQDAAELSRAVYERPLVRAQWQLEDLRAEDLGGAIPWPKFLGWLVATDRLELRIVRLVDGHGTNLYHEKIGLFYDAHGHVVAFSGSSNETEPGYIGNFERIDVFPSFGSDSERRRERAIEAQFQELWSNETPRTEVLSLHEALQRNLLQVRSDEGESGRRTHHELAAAAPNVAPEALYPKAGVALFQHQSRAITEWARAGGKGILEMATGSGKTVTALSLASRLYDRLGSSLAILVVAPYVHLVDQWIDVARDFGLSPVRCAEGSSAWYVSLSTAIQSLNVGRRPILSIATTAATLASAPFQRLLGGMRRPLLLIADEVHTYGSPANLRALPQADVYRVGLSATPERWMDEPGTRRLTEYFGSVVFRYTLADALRDEVLTPYRYYPETMHLDDEEMERYLHITRQLVRFLGEDEAGSVNEIAKRLLIKRARLVGSAREKLPRLRALLRERTAESHVLVYCGDGTIEGPDGEETMRQVDAATQMVGVDLGMRCASYTAETPPAKRRELLQAFSVGDLQVLIAIRCLDEGVDVPATRTAYLLASSTNPRQFVQRRGRVLRRAPNKTRADLYDFFVVPAREEFRLGTSEHRMVRGLLRSQLARSQEFADLAENGPVARQKLLDLRKHFDLLAEG